MRDRAGGKAVSGHLDEGELRVLRRALLRKGSEINDKLTRLLAGQRVSVEELAGGGQPGETPIERLRRYLDLIDGCVKAIDAGTYGCCRGCGAALSFIALEQAPWVDTCRGCAAVAGS